MIVDADKIISDTLKVFFKSEAQQKKFAGLTDFVNAEEYASLHTQFLTPLNIKIDCDLFLREIKAFSNYFEQWGNEHTHLPRYGLALVNRDGMLRSKDPINGSLYEWNAKNPDNPIIESDCRVPTPVMTLESLKALNCFDGSWYRSNIFKWGKDAEFKPHIDAIVPSPWLRLWGTTDAENTEVRCWDPLTKEMKRVTGIETGRIYLIDTSKVHDAISHSEVYQFFLSVRPSAVNIIKDLTWHHSTIL
jgi:hypothetical protein